MGERLLCKQEVIGSIPFTSTNRTAHTRGPLAARKFDLAVSVFRFARSGTFFDIVNRFLHSGR